MNTLELAIQRKTDSGYPVVASLTRPGDFLPLRREGMLTLDPATLSELQYDPLAYGTALGQALFVDEIRDTFVKALGDEPLRVLISVEAPDLRALDWRRLAAPFDGRWRCLASQQNTPFSLSIPSPASAHFPALGRRDLRALLLVAGPESLSGDYKLAPFDVPATIESIKTALGDIPCDVLPNPSLDSLCAALTQTPYTILQLVCHGAVKQETGETILFFPKDSKGTPTPAADLLNRLGSLACLPHFAFISACESALPQNGLGSLAGRLVRELGLPAVLAMTDRVSIATASAIAAPFYAHLYQHGQPDLALAQSLAGLQGAHDLTIPAIFSRLGDRPLFDDNSERALTEKELEFGLDKLAESLPERAPVMDGLRDTFTRRLRSTLGADSKSLSESSRAERKETLDQLNSLSLEALDLSFNALCLGQTPPAYDSRSPFRGLESFRPEDAATFFGREALTRKLVQKLNGHNFLAVLGASGSGKSSLVMAGLIPALDVPYAIFRPGAEPLSELDKALQAGPQLLVVDQFEELFTISAREQRADFISRLLEQSHRLRVVITLRADFLGEVAPFKSLKDEVQNHQEIIPPMDEAELRRSMEAQAACAGLRFESDLSQQMLDDVSGEPGAMPLLQHALWTLWTRRHGRWLRAEEYRAFGGVKQAIASTAEAVFARCTEFEKERLRDIFLRLTRLDDSADGRDTRRRVLLRDLIPADSDPAATTLLIKQLADARLVVVTGDEVEVAHEALIRHWERLRGWFNSDRENLILYESVRSAARLWEASSRNENMLQHRDVRLELANKVSKMQQYSFTEVERAYLVACTGFSDNHIESPGGTTKLSDPFYIEREADIQLRKEICRLGTTITIRSPRQTGKSSLFIRGLQFAKNFGFKVVYFDFQQIDQVYLQSMEAFLSFFVETLIYQLKLNPTRINKIVETSLGPVHGITKLLHTYVLNEITSPIIFGMDEIDCLLRTDFNNEFFGMIRSWHNNRARDEKWRKINILMVGSTEPYLLIADIKQSPFNVGTVLRLADLNYEQVSQLNQMYGDPLSEKYLLQFLHLLGGHPYLTRKALYTLVVEKISWNELQETAIEDYGPFSDHLYWYRLIMNNENARTTLKQISENEDLDNEIARRMEEAGILKKTKRGYEFRCELYQKYFERKFLHAGG